VIASLSIRSTFKICLASSNDIPIILLVEAVFAPCFAVLAALCAACPPDDKTRNSNALIATD
jgi:hypothetical protein